LAGATRTITRSPNLSSVSSRRRSFGAAVRGDRSTPSNSRRSNGSTGLITAACSSRSATSRRPN